MPKEGKASEVGYFKDEKEAALEYNKVAILKFGDFSVLNVV